MVPAPPRKRPTLRDVATRAGVSEAAASFALNDKPGVSAETRARVQEAAKEMGWVPSYAARVLSGAHAGTIGLVIPRSAQAFGTESFFLRLMTGIQDVLSRRHQALLLQVISSVNEEIATYRHWKEENRVDGVVLVDLAIDDPRPAAVAQLDLPAVIVGGPDDDVTIPAVCADDAGAMRSLMEHLAAVGYRSVVYVSGPPRLRHIERRIRTFHAALEDLGFAAGHTVSTDFSASAGAAATEAAMKSATAPEALVFDNEVLTLAGLGVLARLGLRVPDDVGVVSWEDTAVCESLHPSITALRRDPFTFGADVAEILLGVIDGGPVKGYQEPTPALVVRDSTRLTRST